MGSVVEGVKYKGGPKKKIWGDIDEKKNSVWEQIVGCQSRTISTVMVLNFWEVLQSEDFVKK